MHVFIAEGTNQLNLTDQQFQVISNKTIPVVNNMLNTVYNQTIDSMYIFTND